MNLPNDVVAVPSSLFGDFLVTDGTDARLLEPPSAQAFSSSQISEHFGINPLLEVGFPLRVIRISLASDFGVSFDGDIRRHLEPYLAGFAFVICDCSAKRPEPSVGSTEVFLVYPLFRPPWMPAPCPPP